MRRVSAILTSMREQQNLNFVGLDIGTANIRCVVGVLDNASENFLPRVVAYAELPNAGMRKGVVVHAEDVADGIAKVLGEAERMGGVSITSATVNIGGSHVLGQNSRGVIAISAANRQITVMDRQRVEEAATIIQMPANREIIQVFAKNYRVDGQENIKDPVGLQGVRLEVDTHIITAATPSLKTLEAAMEKAAITVSHRTVSSVAAAEAVLDRKQKEHGTALIDIGAGTTSIVVLEDGEIQHVAILPVGGNNITNDLAIGLKTDLEVAELVKLHHISLAKDAAAKKSISLNHDDREYFFSAEDAHMIVEARVEEMMELIDKELKKIQKSKKLPGGAIFVGGTARLPGLADVAVRKLQLPSRIGTIRELEGFAEKTGDTAWATATGLMLMDMVFSQHGADADDEPAGSMVGTVQSLLKRFKNKK